ncbi:MAG: hypothetical protein A2Y33_15155 [Spirochaetes bacterium GWF1_51_8]|nr:MAG: hypothetical protein A2Y33_15155 [Spirochaetes bacterium GWF1_51_8]
MSEKVQAWVVSISMGLGHQRATYPLRDIAYQGIQLIGEKETSSEEDIKLWEKLRNSYEFISKSKKIPIIGPLLFGLLDRVQNIPPLYPLRDMSKPVLSNTVITNFIKKGMGKTLMDKVMATPYPYISSYPVPAHIADFYKLSRQYCIVCDAEINRGWVANYPKTSRIQYFAPCGRSVQRLMQYGVPAERIFLTGFPMPKEVTGGPDLEILRADLAQRLYYLDPTGRFWPYHEMNVAHFLGQENMKFQNERVLNITYAVGGAGALADVGLIIAKSLKKRILDGTVKLNLVAGLREEVFDYFVKGLKELGIPDDTVYVLYAPKAFDYFEKFNILIRKTDIIWTKPSELSFYAGLGIPIIMTQPIGSQEDFNRKWLVEIQAGIDMEDPRYADQWLFDLLEHGRLAEAGWDGFLKGRKYGTYKIEEVIRTGTMVREKSPLRR